MTRGGMFLASSESRATSPPRKDIVGSSCRKLAAAPPTAPQISRSHVAIRGRVSSITRGGMFFASNDSPVSTTHIVGASGGGVKEFRGRLAAASSGSITRGGLPLFTSGSRAPYSPKKDAAASGGGIKGPRANLASPPMFSASTPSSQQKIVARGKVTGSTRGGTFISPSSRSSNASEKDFRGASGGGIKALRRNLGGLKMFMNVPMPNEGIFRSSTEESLSTDKRSSVRVFSVAASASHQHRPVVKKVETGFYDSGGKEY